MYSFKANDRYQGYCGNLVLTRGRQIQIILLCEVSLKVRLKYTVKVFIMKLHKQILLLALLNDHKN